jgi:hypothetical protein
VAESNYRCVSLERFERLEDIVEDLEAVVHGDGHRSLGLNARITIQETTMEKLQRTLSKAVWLCLATFLAVVGDLIARGMHR